MSSVNNFYVKKNLQVDGDLDVRGVTTHTSTTIKTNDLYVKDRYMVLNSEHATAGALNSGFISINKGDTPKTDVISFTTTNINFNTPHGFVPGDYINVTGSAVNSGLFQVNVAAASSTTLTISPSPTTNVFASYMVFTPETVTPPAVTVVKVKLSIIGTGAGTDGEEYQSVVGNNALTGMVTKKLMLSGDAITNETLTLTGASNQLIFNGTGGNANTTIINAPIDPSNDRVYTIPNTLTDSIFVLEAGAQTLTDKTLAAPIITNGSSDGLLIAGGSALGLIGLSIADTGTPAHFVSIKSTSSGIGEARDFILNLGNADRTLTLGGNLSTVGDLSTTGSGNLELITAGDTVMTFPAGPDTVVTLNAAQTLTNKTMTLTNEPHGDLAVTLKYGMNVQTPTLNRIVTLPLGVDGQTVKVLNKSAENSGINMIITRDPANTIEGSNDPFSIGGNQHTSLTCVGTEWRINF
jgi:hypothetical protein